jgi:3-hydroxyisobutyrate dehydrogenase-like beta-hydroxyacid dehydrogenase
MLLLQVVESISKSLIEGSKAGKGKNAYIHISCSTISPSSARRFATLHSDNGHNLITAPVFARPDGAHQCDCVFS